MAGDTGLTEGCAGNMDTSMTDTTSPEGPSAAASPAKPAPKEENFFVFLIKLVLIVAVFRSFIFSPFNIPSESMLPRLLNGDYLLAAKWPYGVSSYSLPFSVPLIPGRILAGQPKRGDVVIFKAPANLQQDWIKRAIGLPGDTVQMKDGQLFLNGNAIPKVRIADFEVTPSPNTHCLPPVGGTAVTFEAVKPDGSQVCRYPQFRETIPTGDGTAQKSYNVLDLGNGDLDNTPAVVVPEGSLFMMGDDRDDSDDSRVPTERGGVGMLPQANLVGRATLMMWSTDGSANWFLPWTWVSAARWSRIGGTF